MITVTDIKIRIPKTSNKIAAFSDIILNEGFCVKNIKIINGAKGIFISMPSIKAQDGTFNNICYPIDKENRHEIESKILKEYNKAVKSSENTNTQDDIGI